MRGLYKGLLPDMAKIAPAAAISWTVFERGVPLEHEIAAIVPQLRQPIKYASCLQFAEGNTQPLCAFEPFNPFKPRFSPGFGAGKAWLGVHETPTRP